MSVIKYEKNYYDSRHCYNIINSFNFLGILD